MNAKSSLKHKRKMQDVSFRNVDEFLEYLPEDELKMVERLREIILQAVPDCTEKLSYNVPFYKRHTNICFIWPSSIAWGNMKRKGVRLGFTKGYLLQDDIGYLDKGDRKQVYWKDFTVLKEINADILLVYIYEAALLDQEQAIQKKTATKRTKRSTLGKAELK